MGSQSIEAGKAFVKLLVDNKDFAKGVDGSLRKLNDFSRSALKLGAAISGMGAAITAPMLAMVHSVVEAGSSMKLMSERTGLTVASLAELRYAAEQSGATIEDVQRALLMGAKKGFDPKQFDQIAASLAAIEEHGKRAEEAFKIFGKGAGAILPMLENLQKLRQEANDLGLVMSEKTAAAAHKLHNAWNTLGRVMGGVKGAIGAALIPTIQKMVELSIRAAIVVRDFVRQHKELVIAAFKVGAALTIAGAAITAVAAVTALAAAVLNPVTAAFGVLALVVSALAPKLIPLAEKWMGITDGAGKATAAIEEHESAERKLSDALDVSTTKIDAKTEALKRLHDEENKAAAEKAIKAEMETQKAREAILGQRLLPGFGGLGLEITGKQQMLSKLQQELTDLREITSGQSLVDEDDTSRMAELSSQIKKLESDLGLLQLQHLVANPFGMAAIMGFGRPFGLLGGAAAQGLWGSGTEYRRRRGLPGFDSPPQITDAMVPRLTGPRGTFNGQLASQIFGSSGTIGQQLGAVRKASERTVRLLENIDRKMGGGGIGPSFKVGLA